MKFLITLLTLLPLTILAGSKGSVLSQKVFPTGEKVVPAMNGKGPAITEIGSIKAVVKPDSSAQLKKDMKTLQQDIDSKNAMIEAGYNQLSLQKGSPLEQQQLRQKLYTVEKSKAILEQELSRLQKLAPAKPSLH